MISRTALSAWSGTGWKVRIAVVLAAMAFLAWAGIAVLASLDYFPGNTYSEGWRMGQLTAYGPSGLPGLRTGEAELAHGVGSSGGEAASKGGEISFRNPGHLSSTTELARRYRDLVGRNVAIRYRQVKVQLTTLGGDTDYRIQEIVPVDPSLAPQKPCVEAHASEGSRGSQTAVGRLVKASDKGNFSKSYEAVLQKGDAGNNFITLSIRSTPMMECATEFTRSGVRVRATYAEGTVRNPLESDTTRTILSLERAE